MENREEIKNRMIKTAARIWGYPEDETASSFDPLVNLLFSACSLELEKISTDIHASRARMLERMVQLLSPDVLTGSVPAHAILYARAVEQSARLHTTDQFYFTKQNDASYDSTNTNYQDIFFAPAGRYHANSTHINYIATGYQLFRYREMISKDVIAQCINGKELSPSVLWLGVTGFNGNLTNTQFYFDIKNEVNREFFYDNLPLTKWFDCNKEMAVINGYSEDLISGEVLNPEQLLTQRNSNAHKIKELVNAFYKARFITIKNQFDFTAQNIHTMPAELLQAFDKTVVQQLHQENIRWIKIQFPENITNTILQDVICHANCFPVINTRLHEITYRLHDILNIVPLYSADSFFTLHQVTDQENNTYHNRDIRTTGKQRLSIMLRQGGVGRFDERDAAAIIENILQLLNDESAAFSVLGREFLSGEMKQLQQIMYKLEQQLISKNLHRENTPFLIVRQLTKEPIGNLFIHFWSTSGNDGNDIKAGTSLQVYKTSDAFYSGCTFVTPTVGGRDKLSASDSIIAYKSALLSRDRLISIEDIKTFCRLQFGSKAKQVDVKKGVMLSQKTSQGFARTLDVTIGLNRKDYMDAQEKNQVNFLKENLILQLTQKSASLVPFRIFIEQVA